MPKGYSEYTVPLQVPAARGGSSVIVVKQADTLHRPVVVRHLNHGKYHLDYSHMYLDVSWFFVRHVYPKLDKSHNATDEMRQVSAQRYLFATMEQRCIYH